jgi:anaerobic magnesium-protoporphyrin IX monomethyl ester cyclase
MNDVTLVFPYFNDGRSKNFKFPPLGIGYIASYLRMHGYRVGIVDCTFKTFDEAVRLASSSRVVGVYSMLSMVKPALEIAEALKDRVELLVAGGPMPSAYPIKFLNTFDMVVQGEGEETMLEVMHELDGGMRFERVKGLHISNRFMKQALETVPVNGGDITSQASGP